MGRAATELILVNGRIWTGEPNRPVAEALAVVGGRISAVGATADIQPLAGPSTRVLDAGGRRVVPGFIDSHLHLPWGAEQLASVDLKDAPNAQELARRIGDRARAAPDEWVEGGGWDEQGWTPPELPTRDAIDPLTGDTPVFVRRYDVHTALANSTALRLAGVGADTPDPVGGTIVRDRTGRPTGVLKDAAMQLVQRAIPPIAAGRRRRRIVHALEQLARAGITSVHDMNPTTADLSLYAELGRESGLTVRIHAVPLETDWYHSRHDEPSPWSPPLDGADASFLHSGGVKGFADGSLGSSTAYFFQPYADAPGNYGLLSEEMQPLEGIRERLIAADEAGRQLCMHAIGDRAVSIMLDLFEDVQRANGVRHRRWRIEHAQHLAPGDFARFAALGVIASVQPYHLVDDGRWAARRIGDERVPRAFAFRTLLGHGARLAFGTDWPVAPLNPMLTLKAAVTRATVDGRHPGGWVPSERLTLEEALDAYTRGAAYAEGAEGEKGSLAVGKLADLVVLSDDPFGVEPARLGDVRVDLTVVGGRVVHGDSQ